MLINSEGGGEALDLFKKQVAPWSVAYSNAGLSYHAVRDGSRLFILHARFFLHVFPTGVPRQEVKFLDQEVGFLTLEELKLDVWEIINHFVSGKALETTRGQIVFPVQEGRSVLTAFHTLHEEGLPSSRMSLLTLTGAPHARERYSLDQDWGLKSNDPPFNGVDELLIAYRLGRYNGELAFMEIPAVHVATLDGNSPVSGEVAEPSVFLPRELEASSLSLGVMVHKEGRVIERRILLGSELKWHEIEDPPNHQYGRGLVRIPLGASIKCFVSYRGVAQHEGWIGDPGSFPNWRRTAYEWADPGCEVLRDFLFEEKKARKESRDFEVGVASLFWMLGFGVLQLRTKRLEENPDLLITTPFGRMALVECTTGVIDTDDKLAKLLSRSKTMKNKLASTGSAHVDLLPVLVTALPFAEVMDFDKATKFGIFVMTKEALLAALERCAFPQDADTTFLDQIQALKTMQDRLA